MNKPNLRQHKKNQQTQKKQSKKQATLVDGEKTSYPGNGVAYSIQAPGPNGLGYWLAGSLVSCRQLETDAGTVALDRTEQLTYWSPFNSITCKCYKLLKAVQFLVHLQL